MGNPKTAVQVMISGQFYTVEEAREIYQGLDKIFGTTHIPYPYTIPTETIIGTVPSDTGKFKVGV